MCAPCRSFCFFIADAAQINSKDAAPAKRQQPDEDVDIELVEKIGQDSDFEDDKDDLLYLPSRPPPADDEVEMDAVDETQQKAGDSPGGSQSKEAGKKTTAKRRRRDDGQDDANDATPSAEEPLPLKVDVDSHVVVEGGAGAPSDASTTVTA